MQARAERKEVRAERKQERAERKQARTEKAEKRDEPRRRGIDVGAVITRALTAAGLMK
jgi:hypothetical protein